MNKTEYNPSWIYLFLMWCLGIHWKEKAIAYYLFRNKSIWFAKEQVEDLNYSDYLKIKRLMSYREWTAFISSSHYKNVQVWY